jgi:hypothetical protein
MPLDTETIERIHDLETDVVVLKKDSELQTKLLEKLDGTTDRLVAMVDVLSQRVLVHDVQFKTQEKQNDNTESLIAERREEAHEDNQRIIENLREFKEDVLTRIDGIKPAVTPVTPAQQVILDKDDARKHSFSGILNQLITNWKWVAFGISFGAGVVTHKWGLLQAVFGISP